MQSETGPREYGPTAALEKYLALGVGEYTADPDELELLQLALTDSNWADAQYTRGWILYEQARLMGGKRCSAKLIEMEDIWREVSQRDLPGPRNIQYPYRAAIGGSYVPYFRHLLLGEPRDDSKLYTDLLAIGMGVLNDYLGRTPNSQKRATLAGVIHELSVLLLFQRAKIVYGTPLQALPSLPRQDNAYGHMGHAWDVTLKHEDDGRLQPLQVKGRVTNADKKRYHPGVVLVQSDRITEGDVNLFVNLECALLEMTDSKSTRPSLLHPSEKLDTATVQLLEVVDRKDLITMLGRKYRTC